MKKEKERLEVGGNAHMPGSKRRQTDLFKGRGNILEM